MPCGLGFFGEDTCRAVGTALGAVIPLSAVLAAGAFIFAPQLLEVSGTRGDAAPLALSYLRSGWPRGTIRPAQEAAQGCSAYREATGSCTPGPRRWGMPNGAQRTMRRVKSQPETASLMQPIRAVPFQFRVAIWLALARRLTRSVPGLKLSACAAAHQSE